MGKKLTYYQKRLRKVRQEHMALLANPNFQKAISGLRKKWAIPERGLKTDKDIEKWHNSFKHQQDKYVFYLGIQEMMKTLRIAPKKEMAVRQYCLYNDDRVPFSLLGAVTIETEDKEGENFTLKLVIGPDTILEDVKQMWKILL
jgi:hypothetical protein